MTFVRRSLSRILLLSALAMPAWAAAQWSPQTQPDPLADDPASRMDGAEQQRHHLGILFRPELGFGYVGSTASSGGTDLSIKGGGASFAIAVGGAVSESFILGVQAWDIIAISPTISLGSTSASTSSDTSSGVVGYGLLLNWYMPGNTYLALTPSLTRLTFSNNGSSYTSDWGFGFRAAFGKEWWVSDHWGLGIAAGGAFSSNKDGGYAGAPTWSTFGFNVNFSATYN